MPSGLGRKLTSFLRIRSNNDDDSKNGSASSSHAQATRTSTPRKQNAPCFRCTVPRSVEPGQKFVVRGPGGGDVEVVVPPGCKPGSQITVKLDESDGAAGDDMTYSSASSTGKSIKELVDVVRSIADATHASCELLWQRLSDELDLQKAMWASSNAVPVEACWQSGKALSLASRDADTDLSQTQALVLAAADARDPKQLLAALSEARKFSSVLLSLEDAVRNVAAVEEAMVTWRCLLSALEVQDRHEIEIWLEQAGKLGLEVPKSLQEVLADLHRQEKESLKQFETRRDVEHKLNFALEAGDPDLLAEVHSESAALGMQSEAAMKVAELVRGKVQSNEFQAHKRQGNANSSDSAQGHVDPRATSTSSQGHPSSAQQEENSKNTQSEFNIPNADRAGGAKPSSCASPEEKPAGDAHSEANDMDPRSVRELLEECRRQNLDTSGCTDRADLMRLLEEGKPSQRPKLMHEQVRFTRSASSAFSAAAPADTVWDRQNAPAHLYSQRSKALWLLGLGKFNDKQVTSADLRSAYRRAALESHPDRAQNHCRQAEAKELFQNVKDAFDYLSSPQGGIRS